MSKRVVLCYSKIPHRELDPFITESALPKLALEWKRNVQLTRVKKGWMMRLEAETRLAVSLRRWIA
jgi:hypothetical protein